MPALVCNTSPLLYLGRINHVHLISALFAPVYVPEPVIVELDAGRLLRPDTIDPRTLDWVTPVSITPALLASLPPNRLGVGERSAIAFGRTQSGCTIGLDDRQARLLAQQLGLAVVGTVGILVSAKRANLIPAARPLLDAVRNQGFRITQEVYAEALRLADEVDI
jgi:predicted nucleic acid-binding protein